MSRFSKQAVEPTRKIQVDLYQDFQGSKAELLFLKFSAFISQYRRNIFIAILAIVVLTIGFVAYAEYHISQVQKATVALEALEDKNAQDPSRDLKVMITEFENIRKDFSAGETKLRTDKILADLHARNGSFVAAAELMEHAGTEIDELREVKAFYFYIAGNYREQGNDSKKALTDFETASGLLNNMRNVPTLMAWTYYHTGRLQYMNGNKTKAAEYLKKIMEIDGTSPQYRKARELATYLLLKISQS